MLIVDWIRHTSLNITGETCYGQTDLPVAATFEEEAEKVREQLSERIYDAVFTSPLSRANRLCEYCGYGDTAVLEARVMERAFGVWEMKPWAEIFAFTAQNPVYLDHHGEVVPPKGETVEQLLSRVGAFIEELRSKGYQRVAVFCHGGVINSARHLQGQIRIDDLFVGVPNYGSVTSLEYLD